MKSFTLLKEVENIEVMLAVACWPMHPTMSEMVKTLGDVRNPRCVCSVGRDQSVVEDRCITAFRARVFSKSC
jgi:hypothetical protein